MSRRKVVNLNLEVLLPLIKKVCRSNVVFCEEMGRPKQKTWVTGWSNKPNPKNLPSPEEAARMCILLNTTPEEILLHEGKTEAETVKCQEDIKLVQELLEKEQSIKKETSDQKAEGLIPYDDKELINAIEKLRRMDKKTLRKFSALANAMLED